MRFFAKYDPEGRLIAVGCGNGGVEITRQEYEEIRRRIIARAAERTEG